MASITVSPTTAANDASAGTNAWSNPSNALTQDDSNATVVTDSQFLLLSGFDVSPIPDEHTIDGLEFEVRAGDGSDPGGLQVVQAKRSGSYVGDNQGTLNLVAGSYVKVGGPTDAWGLSLTGADLKASFGIGLRTTDTGPSVTKFVDHTRLTVYHSFHGVPVLNNPRVRTIGLDGVTVR